MSSFAIGTSSAGHSPGALSPVRHADLVLLALALPVFLVADLPLLGYAVAAVAWLAQTAILHLGERATAGALRAGDRRRALGVTGFATLGRAWLVAAAILLVGLLADREDGLAAAILCAALVTFHLAGLAVARLAGGDQG